MTEEQKLPKFDKDCLIAFLPETETKNPGVILLSVDGELWFAVASDSLKLEKASLCVELT